MNTCLEFFLDAVQSRAFLEGREITARRCPVLKGFASRILEHRLPFEADRCTGPVALEVERDHYNVRMVQLLVGHRLPIQRTAALFQMLAGGLPYFPTLAGLQRKNLRYATSIARKIHPVHRLATVPSKYRMKPERGQGTAILQASLVARKHS